MPLVDYEDSDSDNGDGRTAPSGANTPKIALPSSKRRKLSSSPAADIPPLPDAFRELYTSNVRRSTQDDPQLHGGRHRQVPHVEGNWPTHIYIEWYPNTETTQRLQALIDQERAHLEKIKPDIKLHSLLESDLGAKLPLHISLSRSLTLHAEERQRFTKRLEDGIKQKAVEPCILLAGTRISWASNHEENRWFYILHVQDTTTKTLEGLLQVANDTAHLFGQPLLHASDKDMFGSTGTRQSRDKAHARDQKALASHGLDCFHVSIAWTLDAPVPSEPVEAKRDYKFDVPLSEVKLKIGNAVHGIALTVDDRRGAESGILS